MTSCLSVCYYCSEYITAGQMGAAHSRAGHYENMDGKPVIDKIEYPQETGAEVGWAPDLPAA